MRGELVEADYGAEFKGWVGRTAEKIVCVAPDGYEHDPMACAVLRELVERIGGDCAACGQCPIGSE